MPKELSSIIGKRIRHFRKLKQMKQVDLAELVGKTKATIINWELGHFNIMAKDIPKTAEVLGCTINDLYQ